MGKKRLTSAWEAVFFHSFQTLIVVILCTFVYQHALDCGRGTGIFLIVLSSVIIIIRGDRVCIWGSVYLDSFGEEDRDLRRVNVAVLNLFVSVLLLSTSQSDICRNCLCFFVLFCFHRRGKPLFLSQERFNRLEEQWLTHSFDHMCKRWKRHLNTL